MCLMLNKLHNIVGRFPSKCFVIKSVGLIPPRIFSILRSLFFCLSATATSTLFPVFDGSTPTAVSQLQCSPRLAVGTPTQHIPHRANIIRYGSSVRGLLILLSQLRSCIPCEQPQCQASPPRGIPTILAHHS